VTVRRSVGPAGGDPRPTGLLRRALALFLVLAAVLLPGVGLPAGASAATSSDAPYLSALVPRAPGCIRLGPGWAGVKVFLVQRRLGTTVDRERYLAATEQAVAAFQRHHGLPATGLVGRRTWDALGIPRGFCIDRFTVQPELPLAAGPRQRIRTMLAWAREQVGRRYVWSGAGPLGYDCSGLALQALHAAGLVLPTVTTFDHQHSDFPTAAAIRDSGLLRVPFAHRRRGDLVFWGGGPGGALTHMALYLGNDRVVEAVRPRVHVASVWSHSVPLEPYVVRPFPLR
jgi:NlpC/P60 family/Putative peptidoglycan binding domain